MITHRLEEVYSTTLTPQTADLVRRYAEVDTEGFVTNYKIINDEVIEALKEAARHLADDLLYGEQLSEYWEYPSPCVSCESAAGCSMTCRAKHAFDKDIYGGLLCGELPCSYLAYDTADGEKNKVCFKVRLDDADRLVVARPVEVTPDGLRFVGNRVVVVGGKGVVLRPWSMALYRFFVRHPEGVPLAAIYTDHRKEFVKIYESVVRSEVKSARLKTLLKNGNRIQRTLNNKLSELNVELRSQGVAGEFEVSTSEPRTGHRPYYIARLHNMAEGAEM